jgi:hypothetical protein
MVRWSLYFVSVSLGLLVGLLLAGWVIVSYMIS